MGWVYLLIAAIFEVGWPLGYKLASITGNKTFWIFFAIISMILSGYFLYIAQKEIPIGTAYAVWTGIGATCTFIIGVIAFHDALSLMKIFGAFLVITGVMMLKFAG